MKLPCRLSYSAWCVKVCQWHKWFAWRPVRIGPREFRWLEYVERKGKRLRDDYNMFWVWEYRA